MPRARNLKYSFFENDELADLNPLARLLFIGMWTIADYKGDFEWRKRKVKKQILPYDDCNISELAINLDKSGFIRFYSDGEKIYCRVVNFEKHQHPHKNEREKGSDIPAYTEDMRQLIDFKGLEINLDKSGLNRNNSASARADSLNLIPDSCNPNPDSLNPNPEPSPPPKSGEGKKFKFTDEDFSFAERMLNSIRIVQPDFKQPNLDSWANVIRLMRERDKRDYQDMAEIWVFARSETFWSWLTEPRDFRKNYDKLKAKKLSQGVQHETRQPVDNSPAAQVERAYQQLESEQRREAERPIN